MESIQKWQFASSSSDATYETVKWQDGTYSCNCPGWKIKKQNMDRTCKHIKQVTKTPVKTDQERIAENMIAAAKKPANGRPTFIKPMLAQAAPKGPWITSHTPGDWIAEPKFDGKRAQVFIRDGVTVACYSRLGNDFLTNNENGVGWLRNVKWPFASATLDGELCSENGLCIAGNGTSAGRSTAGLDLGFIVFDILELDGRDLKPLHWTARREALESSFKEFKAVNLVTITPVSFDAATLWTKWVDEMGGEGIILKDTRAAYHPGRRSDKWLKYKMEITVDVVVSGIATKPTYQLDKYRTGEGALTYGYWDATAGKVIDIGQGIKVGKLADLTKLVGKVAEMKCAGIMVSGALRHGVFLRWRDDKEATECVRPEAA